MKAPIAFQSSEGQFAFEGVAQLLNAYAEKRGPDAKAPLSVLPCHGIVEATDEAPGFCRGGIFMPDLGTNGVLYTFHPSSCYKTTYDGTTFTTVRVGTVPGIDRVQLSRNQNADPQVTIKTDADVFVLSSDSITPITDTEFPDDVVTADYSSGYTVVGRANRIFNVSGINQSLTWDELDFATFEDAAGKLVRITEHAGQLIGFLDRHTEFWKDTGGSDFPFTQIASKGYGLLAANAVVPSDKTLMFPTNDKLICRLNNYDVQRISTHSIERLISADPSADEMLGFGWDDDGHAFANFTGTDWSRCYDSATGVWHSRQSYGYDKWRGQFAWPAWNKVLVGDAHSGKLGYFDRDTYTEFGDPMVWGVDSPPLHVFPNGAICDALHLDIATGYGTLSGQGSDPKIMLQVSKDGGSTFGQYRELSLGVRGKYATRVTARGLGKFGPKGIVFRLRVSDPVARGLVNTDLELRPLKR